MEVPQQPSQIGFNNSPNAGLIVHGILLPFLFPCSSLTLQLVAANNSARPAFYKYTAIMFWTNAALAFFAWGLVTNCIEFGFRLYDATIICCHTFYLPLIHVTFLADFFQEEDMHLENVYYLEMKDANFFDTDWE